MPVTQYDIKLTYFAFQCNVDLNSNPILIKVKGGPRLACGAGQPPPPRGVAEQAKQPPCLLSKASEATPRFFNFFFQTKYTGKIKPSSPNENRDENGDENGDENDDKN